MYISNGLVIYMEIEGVGVTEWDRVGQKGRRKDIVLRLQRTGRWKKFALRIRGVEKDVYDKMEERYLATSELGVVIAVRLQTTSL